MKDIKIQIKIQIIVLVQKIENIFMIFIQKTIIRILKIKNLKVKIIIILIIKF